MATVNEKMTAIADAIRDKTGEAELLTLDDMAAGVLEVYEAGKDEINRAWWDALLTRPETTTHSQRWNYRFFFVDFSPLGGFNPPYQIKPANGSNLFYGTVGIEFLSKETIDFSLCTSMTSAFERCAIKEIELIDTRNATDIRWLFNENGGTTKVNKLILKEDGSQTVNAASFMSAYYLKEIYIEGKIGGSVSFTYCNLIPESTKSVINALMDYSGTDKEGVYTCLIPEKCWTALEAESTAPDGGTWKSFAQSKGWLI